MWEIFEVNTKEEADLLIEALRLLIPDANSVEEENKIADLIERLS